MQTNSDVADLTHLCAQLCNLGSLPSASPQPQPTANTSHIQQLRLRADTLEAIKSPDRAASHAELLQQLVTHDPRVANAVRRAACDGLAQLLCCCPAAVDHQKAYHLVHKGLGEALGPASGPALAAVMRLAAALAHFCSWDEEESQQETGQGDDEEEEEGSIPRMKVAPSPQDTSEGEAIPASATAKRQRLHEQQHIHLAAQQQTSSRGGYASGRLMTAAQSCALHRGLVAWASHWHPAVRSAALDGLLGAHDATAGNTVDKLQFKAGAGLLSPLQGVPRLDAQQPNPSGAEYQNTGPASTPPDTLVAAAYGAAVDSLADDVEGARLRAMRLTAVLGSQHPGLELGGPRWLQFAAPLPLVDDAFQRLGACVGDGERTVRTQALLLMSGLQGAGLRVKLQVLSKKATISVASSQQQQQLPQGTSRGSQAQAGAGVAAGAQAQGGAASAGSGTAWAGPPGTRGLDLLDASIGALVHGSEDEASAVRTATVAVLRSLALQELDALGADISALHDSSEGRMSAAAAAQRVLRGHVGSERRQVAEQCAEYLCDLLGDEMVGVREAAAGALADVASASGQLRPGPSSIADTLSTQRAGELQQVQQQQEGAAGSVPSAGGVLLLDAQQLQLLVAALHDRSQAVRLRVLKTLSYMRLTTQELMLAFAMAAARCCAGQGHEQAAALASVRNVGMHSPAVARTVATAIAHNHQQQLAARKQQQAGQTVAPGPQGSDLMIKKEHLLVMRELLAGCQSADTQDH